MSFFGLVASSWVGDPTLRFPGALLELGAGASGTEAGKAIGATKGTNGATEGTMDFDDDKCSLLSSLANLIADLADLNTLFVSR